MLECTPMHLLEPWNLVFFAGFVVYTMIRAIYASRTKNESKIENRADAGERALLAVVFLGSLVLPLLYLFTPLLDFATVQLPWFVPCCGLALLCAALWLFWRSHADLGLNWSITLEVRKGHELVTSGVYRSIRHPMYASIALFGLSQGMLLANWLAGWSAAVTFLPLYLRRVSIEERMMLDTFGETYQEYAAKTGRIWPRRRHPTG